jgi:hypothetical protein
MEIHEAAAVNGSGRKMGTVVPVRVVKFYFPPTRLFLHRRDILNFATSRATWAFLLVLMYLLVDV